MNKPSLIINFRWDGIGARTKRLFHSLNVANQLNIPHLIIWPLMPWYKCSFKNLFDEKYYDYIDYPINIVNNNWNNLKDDDVHITKKFLLNIINKIKFQTINNNIITPKLSTELLKKILNNEKLKIANYNWHIIENNKRLDKNKAIDINDYDIIVTGYNFMNINLNQKIDVIKPSNYIFNEINNFTTKYNFNHMIGVHVRRGDRTKVYPLESYYEKIDMFKKKYPILLCTENIDVINEFKKKYNNRVFYYPVSGYGYEKSEFIRDAFIELLLLSKCNYIIVGAESSFGRTAINLGNHEKKIMIDSKFIINESASWNIKKKWWI